MMKLKYFAFAAMDLWNCILVIGRCSILCLLLGCFNHSILNILPFAILIDWWIFLYSTQSVAIGQLDELEKTVNILKEDRVRMEIVEDETIRKIDAEMRKYKLFQWGNKNGEKRTIVIRLDRLFGQFKSFTLYNATSVIFVPKTFYLEDVKDRTMLIHEFSHCISHDLLLVFKKHFYYSAVILVLLILFSSLSLWLKIFSVVLAIVIALLQVWPVVYNEIEANNHALEVINTLHGAKAMSESAEYLLKIRKQTLIKIKEDNESRLAYVVEKLQIEFLQRVIDNNELIHQISPMNIWISIIYYTLFASSAYACFFSIKDMAISGYILIGVPLVFMLITIISKINTTKLWKKKDLVYKMIGIQ